MQLRGLNKIKVELDDDPILGDLNTLILEFSFWEKTRWINLKIVPQFTQWDHPDSNLFKKMNAPSKITIESVKKTQDIVYLTVNRYSKPSESLHFRIFSEDKNELDLVLGHFKTEKNVCEIISLFAKKKNKIQEIFSTISVRLHQNRNLTDDYLCTQIIEKVDIGICADIEIEPGADAIVVMSQIQIAIDSIISPKINFYSLSQLVKEGYHSEDIFLGPKLTHGFLKDEEIEKAQLTNEIHTSDIIAVLMAIKGVKSVKNLLMTAYNLLGKPIPNAINKSWVLTLNGEVKPVFNALKSKLLLFQKNIPFLLSENQLMLVEQKVIMSKTLFNQKKLKGANNDFEVENGTYYPLNSYSSIQDEFPVTYGLGKNYLSDKETDLRKAQAKQLKGYLFFYEQILADFFSQLYNAKELFNTDVDALKKSYFPTYLDKDDETGNDFYSKELYKEGFKKILLEGESENDVSLYESKTLFYDRKNRVLDHLMARFAESFSDYVFMMYQVSGDTSGMGSLSFDYDDLILDKQNFINAYPEISSNRGLGIDYLNAAIVSNTLHFNPFWKTDHRGGYEKRVAKLLGINEIPLRNIVTEEGPQTQWTVETLNEDFLFKIITPATNLQEKWDWAQLHFLDQNLYKIYKVGVHFYLYLVDDNKKIARLEHKFISEAKAFEYLQKMIKTLNLYYENFYCLEHILLRPFNNKTFLDDDLLSVCLNDECDDIANNDPYSFKATIVLPGYLSRFKNLTFRKYAEKIFRQEAPAHVLLKICWVNEKDLLAFQRKYKIWLQNHRQYRLDFCRNKLTPAKETKYKIELNELVVALKELNTIYPEGNLYDCQLSESINPIILGNTSLGTL
ncbi:hypothetical protein CLU83_3719 [Flavobacterium sp. 1]|uniref:hypothetical protein n=1 Tax=Flavobacterium sp. 1 TaxID=2035200 RepID=UPI000C23344D|nr:hypothetical protein [Flavobacterium sp. 1]PJJ10316.1 hypothetical protein CLU83_3719 [Flavobacterium sp. 1]